MKKKGQALIEFVLILPVLLLLIFAFFDVSRIMISKNHLENVMNEVSKLLAKNSDLHTIQLFLEEDDDYDITIDLKNGEYTVVTLKTSLDLLTPGLGKVLSNPYVVKVERSIVGE